jgi:hypothetical protein
LVNDQKISFGDRKTFLVDNWNVFQQQLNFFQKWQKKFNHEDTSGDWATSIVQLKFSGQQPTLFLSSDQNCFEAQPKRILAKEQILSRFGNSKLAIKCFWAMIIFFQSLDQWCKLNHHQSNDWKFWVTNKK